MSNIFIISGPSGAGEDSVISELKKYFPIEVVITTTTRPMRPNESQGNPYYFISKKEFENKIKLNEFFEYTLEDNGNLYGGTDKELERVKKSDKPVIWKIDYKGVISAKKIVPEAKSIYLYVPPELIKKRLGARGDSSEIIKSRLEYSKGWYENESIFDYKVYNEDGKLDETVKKVAEIIRKNLNAQSN